MKQLDKSHIFITEKHITRKLIRVGWGTGKYLGLFRHLTLEWQAQVEDINVTSQILPIP